MTHKNISAENDYPVCIGTGLVALDVVINNNLKNYCQFFAGGSCGNVLTILSYLGWNSYPIARLSNNAATDLLLADLSSWNVKSDLITTTSDGSTPTIIHRILVDKHGLPKHRFEFKNPETGKYLPSYKPCLAKAVPEILAKSPTPNVFYFDRINRASLDLAMAFKENGSLIFFEPSNMKDEKAFNKCLEIADIVKFSDERISDYDSIFRTGQANIEIQTLGERGLKFRKKGKSDWIELKGYSISNVIDAAGAGDWCTAGIISRIFANNQSYLSDEKALRNALQFGQMLSALNCTCEGARGLMYRLNSTDLLTITDQMVSDNSNTNIVASHRMQPSRQKEHTKQLKISSLFVDA